RTDGPRDCLRWGGETMTKRIRILAFLVLAMIWVWAAAGPAWACDAKGHDCRMDMGYAGFRDLPFRVARTQFFDKQGVNAELIFVGDSAGRAGRLMTGDSLLALVSLADAAVLTKDYGLLRAIAVLQARPDAFVVLAKNIKQLGDLKGSSLGVSDVNAGD